MQTLWKYFFFQSRICFIFIRYYFSLSSFSSSSRWLCVCIRLVDVPIFHCSFSRSVRHSSIPFTILYTVDCLIVDADVDIVVGCPPRALYHLFANSLTRSLASEYSFIACIICPTKAIGATVCNQNAQFFPFLFFSL